MRLAGAGMVTLHGGKSAAVMAHHRACSPFQEGKECEGYLRARAGIDPVRDPSNSNAEYDRVAVRQWLAQAPHPFAIARTNRTARALHDASDALVWMVQTLAEERIVEDTRYAAVRLLANTPRLKRRLLVACITRLDPALQPRARGQVDIYRTGRGPDRDDRQFAVQRRALWTFARACAVGRSSPQRTKETPLFRAKCSLYYHSAFAYIASMSRRSAVKTSGVDDERRTGIQR